MNFLFPSPVRRKNPFWRNTRLEKHENDPLDTNPPPPPPAPGQPSELVCRACDCRLARSGAVLDTGERYKKFLKSEQIIEEKEREISRLNTELIAVKSERDALKAAQGSGSGASSGHRPGGRIQ